LSRGSLDPIVSKGGGRTGNLEGSARVGKKMSCSTAGRPDWVGKEKNYQLISLFATLVRPYP